MNDLDGKAILITGGSSGIGRGTAEHLVGLGCRVTIAGRRADRIESVASELGELVRGVVGDVTVPGDRTRMVTEAVEHGGGRLDGLVSNAGNMYRGPITELDDQRLLDLFNVNVVAGMQLTGLAVPHLSESEGCVVFIGSVHTKRAFPGVSPYAATKGAVEALTAVLAAELGPQGIRVSCVRPGAIPSEINVRAGLATPEENLERLESLAPAHALGRIGTPLHIAEAISYLIGADWTTGGVVDVDGGLGLGVTNR
ncbi:MAG: SDR family NAD(P)-dependent oxidoreductase [Acidimicrobiales bacterium]